MARTILVRHSHHRHRTQPSRIDASIPLELFGPLGCGIQTGAGSIVRALDVQPGTSLTVFGAGAVGLAAVIAATTVGADQIVVVDLQPRRLELALELGATHIIDGPMPTCPIASWRSPLGRIHRPYDGSELWRCPADFRPIDSSSSSRSTRSTTPNGHPSRAGPSSSRPDRP